MSKHGSIKRYSLIIEKITKTSFPSFAAIRDFLFEHGFEVSDRTIQRDIEQIRFDFGIEITYNREMSGYFINEEETFNVEAFMRFLEIANTANLLIETLIESKEALNFIDFEASGQLKGIQYLEKLLFAVKHNRIVAFTYKKFDTDNEISIRLMPYLLKEYQSRWYVVGIIEGRDQFRTYGIDRIRSLEVDEITFQRNARQHPEKLFESTIGLTYSAGEEENVILSFTPYQGNYVKTLPWHPSQQIIIDNETELRIKLRVVPNYEFIQKILMHTQTVTVIQPRTLADHIRQILHDALKKYQSPTP